MTQSRPSPPRRSRPGRRFDPNAPDPNAADLAAIGQSMLIPLVQRNLNSEVVQVGEWSSEPVRKGAGGSRLYRFSGTGRDRDQDVSWAMYLKVIRPGESFSDPDAAQREVLVYRSGLLDHLPGGIVAPRVFDVVTRADDATWVWLEEVKDEVEGKWPLARYGLAARHLGQFNGAYIAGQPLPTYPWLSRGWLRGLVARYGSGIESFFDSSLPPWMAHAFPADVRERTCSLWAGRETLLDALDRLPKTFCHMDAFRNNLFARRCPQQGERTVAIDWSYSGIGAVGEELAPLISIGAAGFGEDPLNPTALDEIAFQEYVNGLRDAGWCGDPGAARLGYVAAASLRYGLMFAAGAARFQSMDEETRAEWERNRPPNFEKMMDRFRARERFLLDRADEAFELVRTV